MSVTRRAGHVRKRTKVPSTFLKPHYSYSVILKYNILYFIKLFSLEILPTIEPKNYKGTTFLMEFLDQANLHNWLSCLQKHQKFKVSALKEDQKRKVFLDFYTS